ncbi:MAG: bleomycin hydrolase [Bacteroidales bacterium]|jgi:bleomycin hydrolase|nr:bleomycin hydrolase [Bacteroidales bacterium]MDN5329562.1 bleomycin hydrolase [Bacteroidales bacterium]
MKIKSVVILFLGLNLAFPGRAQQEKIDSTYHFSLKKEIPHTSVKDQYRSGTCWSFSTLSFFESELIRAGKGEFDLSEMFCIRDAYEKKAERYVRMHGSLNFGGGGAFHDVLHTIVQRGIVPENIYPGLNYGENKHVHGELDAVTKAYVDAIIKNPNRKLSTVWLEGFKGILDAYLGKVPEKFNYNGKEYTPRSFADMLGIKEDDYICLTSYTHHPFYKKFILEVPDNWAWGELYNLPLDDLMEVMDYALENGYSVAWAADVSEKGFAYNKGLAVIPETDVAELTGSEKARWEKLTEKERASQMYNLDRIVPEKKVTQEMRQKEFDNYQTTDDHGMHMVGYGFDQFGNKYYYIKNSWGADNKFDGYFYASVPFVRLKTMDIMVHKNAIPPAIRKKLGL